MDCVTSKAVVGVFVGAVLALVSLVAVYGSSDLLHYLTAVTYLVSLFFAHYPASKISKSRCSIKHGIFFYLSITFISWVAIFNLVYAVTKP